MLSTSPHSQQYRPQSVQPVKRNSPPYAQPDNTTPTIAIKVGSATIAATPAYVYSYRKDKRPGGKIGDTPAIGQTPILKPNTDTGKSLNQEQVLVKYQNISLLKQRIIIPGLA